MGNIVCDNKDFVISKSDYSSGSFHKYIFKNLNTSINGSVSFHRADFRGATMINSKFINVDFSRCDFIAMNIENVTFQHSSFESATIMNNIISKSIFIDNNTKSLDLLKNSFIDCEFINQNFYDSTWNNLIFRNTKFENFLIEKSTAQDIEFINCNIHNINFANLTAIDFMFKNCNLKNVIFDADYIGSYCFDSVSLGDISYTYKDEIFKFSLENKQNIKKLSEYLISSNRFSEAFGLAAILKIQGLTQENLKNYWITSLSHSSKITNEYEAVDNINRLFKSLKFYVEENIIDIYDLIDICIDLENQKSTYLHPMIEENLFYISSYIHNYIEKAKYSIEHLITKETNTKKIVYMKITFDTDSFLEAEKILQSIFLQVLNQNIDSYYIVDTRKGSIIITVASVLCIGLILSKMILLYQDSYFKFRIKYEKYKTDMMIEHKKQERIQQISLESIKSINELIKINNTISENTNTKEILQQVSELELYLQ